jgi:hypothetical protein
MAQAALTRTKINTKPTQRVVPAWDCGMRKMGSRVS